MRKLTGTLILISSLGWGLLQPVLAVDKPNIIVILSDDMGYSDISPYGSEIRTPNLERMAKEGLRFSQFYTTPRCSTTRASLLTGRYSHAVGMGHLTNVPVIQKPGYMRDLRTDNNWTLGEVLRTAGYRTQAIGKWHVAKHEEAATSAADKYNWPLQRGFDDFYGIMAGAGRFFDPSTLVRQNGPISPFSAAEQAIYPKEHYDVEDYAAAEQQVDRDSSARPSANKYHLTDAISDHAVMNIQEHFSNPATQGQPLFQYIAYTSAHWPLHAKPEDIAKYDGVYGEGYAAIRQRRFATAKAKGVIPANVALPKAVGDWNAHDPEVRALEEHAMQVYAAQVDQMDQGIGRILAALEAQGQLDNTIVMYMQDNGGNHEGGTVPHRLSAAVPQRSKGPSGPTLGAEELQPIYLFDGFTRDGYPVRRGFGVKAGSPDTYQFYSEEWGNVSNTPFSDYKSDTGEGGIATPLIVFWNNGIDRRLRGRVVGDVAHIIDVMATVIDITGAQHSSSDARARVDGLSLMPVFSGKAIHRADAVYWEHEGWRAVRHGKWKALTRGPAGAWELYDMELDRVEMNNVAADQPRIVKKLAQRWEAWALANDVISETGAWPWTPKHPIGKYR